MAERRMFAKNVIDSDLFLDMPLSTQALYFHLAMRADDDGFVNNPKKVLRMIGANEDSLKILIAKSFLIPFETGIVVIRHWKVHNYIRRDTYKPTAYAAEKALLSVDESDRYISCNDDVTYSSRDCNETLTQDRLGKERLGKVSIDKDKQKPQKHKFGEFNHVKLTDDEYTRLCEDYGKDTADYYIRKVDEYCEMKGKTYQNYNLAIRNTFMARDNIRKVERPSEKPDEELSVQEQIFRKLRC